MEERMDIGDLEAEIISIVKKQVKSSSADVLELLQGERKLAYTTISTTLDRLYRKGLLIREPAVGKGGIHYLYSYNERTTLHKEIVNRVVDKLVNAFGSAAVSAILDRLGDNTKENMEKLRPASSKRRGGNSD